MIGNDVVDLELAAAENNWRRAGYLEKICTPAERQLVQDAADPDRMVWLLWSAKEAAYKIVHRTTGQRIYAPHRYAVQLSGRDTGTVCYETMTFHFRTTVDGSRLHSIAVPAEHLWYQLSCGVEAGELLLKDEQGVPFVREASSGRRRPASVSHHGKYYEVVSLKI